MSLKVDSIKTQLAGIVIQINTLTFQLTTVNANITIINAQIVILNQQYIDLLAALNAILAQLTITPTSLSSGLIAWYPFNGNANDSSGNGYNATIHGATNSTNRFGNNNSAYSFNGSSYILSNTTFYQSSENHSISMWLKIDSTIANQTIYNTIPHTTEGVFYNLITQNQLCFYLGNGIPGSWSVATVGSKNIMNTNLTTKTWYNLIVLFSKVNSTWQYYLNGNLINTFISSSSTYSGLSQIGFGASFVYGNSQFFIGSLDDIKIFSRSLTQSEITFIANH